MPQVELRKESKSVRHRTREASAAQRLRPEEKGMVGQQGWKGGIQRRRPEGAEARQRASRDGTREAMKRTPKFCK